MTGIENFLAEVNNLGIGRHLRLVKLKRLGIGAGVWVIIADSNRGLGSVGLLYHSFVNQPSGSRHSYKHVLHIALFLGCEADCISAVASAAL